MKTKRRQKRDRIVSEAAELFWRKGYEATSIADMARASEMNKAMLYYYFPDKETILYEVLVSVLRKSMPKANSIAQLQTSAGEKLRLLVKLHIDVYADNLAVAHAALMERRSLTPGLLDKFIVQRDTYEGIFRGVISQGIETGEFRNTDVRLTSLFVLGMLNSMVHWYKVTGACSAEELADWVTNFIRTGIGLSDSTASLQQPIAVAASK